LPLRPVYNEDVLLEAVAKGNEKAFAELFYAYHNQLGEYVQILTNSDELTKEIVQDVFVKIWMNRENLPDVRNFLSYLFILARNYTLNCIRRVVNEKKRKAAFELFAIHNEDVISENAMPDYDQVIDRAIAQLPPQQQRVFVLKQSGRKNADIASEMGISPESVKKYQQWAVKAIAEFVKSHTELTVVFAAIMVLQK
jgi:RNA polymerase sigma factor (sigma-70 family)